MAYDFHYDESDPGPVTPLDNLVQVIDYSLSHVPPEKLVLGVPTYGYDWTNKGGEALQYKQFLDLARQKNVTPSRDPISSAMTFVYKDQGAKHEVWYEDAQSTKTKIAYARSRGIYQFCFWRIGDEDPNTWVMD